MSVLTIPVGQMSTKWEKGNLDILHLDLEESHNTVRNVLHIFPCFCMILQFSHFDLHGCVYSSFLPACHINITACKDS